ncbi:MAG TPA: hypothetical protein VD738_08985 [Nitrospira sp.]|nr:hypothetical protein [Nitrospira sp.]
MTATPSLHQIASPRPLCTEPLKRIAIFAATSWELDAVRAALATGVEQRVDDARVWVCTVGPREYWLARTGMGLEKAGRVAARVLTHQPFSLAVSTGFACALIAAEIGTLLVGCEVVSDDGVGTEPSRTIDVPGVERDAVLTLAAESTPPAHVGRFVSVARIVGRASEKQRFARATGAIGLDMESAALAVEAQRAHVPFVVVRAVSDRVDEDLPLDFNLFLRPTEWLRGIATVLAAPSSLLGLGRLRRQSGVAAKSLTTFFQRYATVQATDDIHAGLLVEPS